MSSAEAVPVRACCQGKANPQRKPEPQSGPLIALRSNPVQLDQHVLHALDCFGYALAWKSAEGRGATTSPVWKHLGPALGRLQSFRLRHLRTKVQYCRLGEGDNPLPHLLPSAQMYHVGHADLVSLLAWQ